MSNKHNTRLEKKNPNPKQTKENLLMNRTIITAQLVFIHIQKNIIMNPKFLVEKLFHVDLNKNKFCALIHHQQETSFTAACPFSPCRDQTGTQRSLQQEDLLVFSFTVCYFAFKFSLLDQSHSLELCHS